MSVGKHTGLMILRTGTGMATIGGAFSVHSGRGGGGAPPNGLLNNLIAYWPGDEPAGNALDLHVNALHLIDINTVTSNPGHVYPLARQYTLVNNEYHTRPGDDALLSTGVVDFTIAQWLYLDSKPATLMLSASKWIALQQEYNLQWNNGLDRFRFVVYSGGAGNPVAANTFGAPGLATWYLVIGWYDCVALTVNIQVNNGGVDSLGGVAAPADGTATFQISAENTPQYFWDGRIGPSMFWKSAPAGGGVLTAAQRTALWNGGAGLPYADFTP